MFTLFCILCNSVSCCLFQFTIVPFKKTLTLTHTVTWRKPWLFDLFSACRRRVVFFHVFLAPRSLPDDCIRQRFWFWFFAISVQKLFRKMQNRDIHVDAVRYYALGLQKKRKKKKKTVLTSLYNLAQKKHFYFAKEFRRIHRHQDFVRHHLFSTSN